MGQALSVTDARQLSREQRLALVPEKEMMRLRQSTCPELPTTSKICPFVDCDGEVFLLLNRLSIAVPNVIGAYVPDWGSDALRAVLNDHAPRVVHTCYCMPRRLLVLATAPWYNSETGGSVGNCSIEATEAEISRRFHVVNNSGTLLRSFASSSPAGQQPVIANREFQRIFGMVPLPSGNFLVHTLPASSKAFIINQGKALVDRVVAEFNPSDGTYVRSYPHPGSTLSVRAFFTMNIVTVHPQSSFQVRPITGDFVFRAGSAFLSLRGSLFNKDVLHRVCPGGQPAPVPYKFPTHAQMRLRCDSEDNTLVVLLDALCVVVVDRNFELRTVFSLVEEGHHEMYKHQAVRVTDKQLILTPDDTLVWWDVFQRRLVRFPSSLWKSQKAGKP